MARQRARKPSKHRREKPAAASPGAGQPWLHGHHPCLAAIANPRRQIKRLIIKSGDADLEAQVAAAIEQSGAPRPEPELRDAQELDALLGSDARHQGIALLVEPLEDLALEDVLKETENQNDILIVVLDQATDPRNVGAVLRSAAAFGAAAVIVQDRHGPAETGVMAKAASGAMEVTPLVRVTNIVRALETMAEHGFWSFGLDGYSDQNLSEVDLKGKCTLVFGAEGSGLRRLVKEACDHLVKIPISEHMESLNLSNAVAIALYDRARRQ